MRDLATASATAVRAGIEHGDWSAREVLAAVLDRTAACEPEIGAFLTPTPELARQQADAIDDARAGGRPLPPLAGVTLATKDNLCTAGVRTTAGSRMLEDYVPPYTATVVQRLLAAGAMLVAKTNLDEFAMGSSTENSALGVTRNPWDVSRVPGGSSGGSTASVASCTSHVALGSDTGGSIRQPAAFCGVVGMKPTYGRVSRYGLIAFASSFDQIGPIARSIEDAALVYGCIAGHDALDSTCASEPVEQWTPTGEPNVRGLRVGVPAELFDGVDAPVADAVHGAINRLVEAGATVEGCSLPSAGFSLAAYYILTPAECSSNLARFDGVRYGHANAAGARAARGEAFGAEVKQRIMVGTYALSAGYYDAYYRRAQQLRTRLHTEFLSLFERYDVLAGPTTPTVAFRAGERSDPLAMKRADVCTIPANLAGLPALSLPCGTVGGLPVGLQLIAPAFAETTLFSAGHAVEAATPSIGLPGARR